jgi:putative acetyltransferase
MSLIVEHIESPTDDARRLVAALDAELNADYPPEQRHGYSIERIFQPHILFFIARLDGEAVGCGGVALEDGYAEVKRMYVHPKARG